MKTRYFTLVIFLVLGMVIFSNYTSKKSSEKENASLLYMLEEEKLARDVYTHLYEKWETKQFGNIKESEQTHVEKVQELLDKNKIPYQVLPQGKFNNQELQKLQPITSGIKNCRINSLFKICSPLQLSFNLTENHPQTATFHTATVWW